MTGTETSIGEKIAGFGRSAKDNAKEYAAPGMKDLPDFMNMEVDSDRYAEMSYRHVGSLDASQIKDIPIYQVIEDFHKNGQVYPDGYHDAVFNSFEGIMDKVSVAVDDAREREGYHGMLNQVPYVSVES